MYFCFLKLLLENYCKDCSSNLDYWVSPTHQWVRFFFLKLWFSCWDYIEQHIEPKENDLHSPSDCQSDYDLKCQINWIVSEYSVVQGTKPFIKKTFTPLDRLNSMLGGINSDWIDNVDHHKDHKFEASLVNRFYFRNIPFSIYTMLILEQCTTYEE